MSDGVRGKLPANWLGLAISILIAVAIAIIVVWSSWLEQRQLYDEASRKAAYYAKYAKDQISVKCIDMTGQARSDCTHKENETARENQRKEYDLYSQRAMALWTGVMGGMAVVGVALSGVGVYLIWQTWRESHASVIAIRAEQRPWLRPTKIDAKCKLLPGERVQTIVSPEIENFGKTPAQSVQFTYKPLEDPHDHLERTEAKAFWEAAKSKTAFDLWHGRPVFPDKPETLAVSTVWDLPERIWMPDSVTHIRMEFLYSITYFGIYGGSVFATGGRFTILLDRKAQVPETGVVDADVIVAHNEMGANIE